MITPEVISAHNLTQEEFQRITELLGREPTLDELGIFSVMWSEHCSYKSSRIHLKRLPTTGTRVIVPPGENAGVVDLGDGWCAAFKIESHNHPSFIEPFQGAATGVGGILRDIFTMGARPVASMNSLRFGSLDHPRYGRRNRSLLAGVVDGIAHYGNAFGVATVGGEVAFDDAYALNPLVNAFALVSCGTIRFSSARRQASGIQFCMWVPKRVAMVFTGQLWRQLSLTKKPWRNVLPFKLVIPSSRSFCWKPVLKRCVVVRSLEFRTWALRD
jgi:phosphoribosylformylglycinamidine (FGAM) synthase-like enzyme